MITERCGRRKLEGNDDRLAHFEEPWIYIYRKLLLSERTSLQTTPFHGLLVVANLSVQDIRYSRPHSGDPMLSNVNVLTTAREFGLPSDETLASVQRSSSETVS